MSADGHDVAHGQMWSDGNTDLSVAATDGTYVAVYADNSGDEYRGSTLVVPLVFLLAHFHLTEDVWHGVDAEEGAALLGELQREEAT